MDADSAAKQPIAAEGRRSWTSHETPGVYEMRPCPGAPWSTLDEAALAAYYSGSTPGAPGDAVRDLAVLAAQDRFNVRRDSAIQPTVAGYALFGVHPEQLRPAWRVTALRLAGSELAAPVVDRLDTEGPAPQAIAQVTVFLERNLSVTPQEGSGAQEYPQPAVREAVANAVAHRDYAAPMQVFVRLFDDRLEVESPGGLAPGTTLEELLAGGESRPRNLVIAGTLRRMGLMSEAGRGLALIRQELERLGSPPAEFAVDGQRFRVILRPMRT